MGGIALGNGVVVRLGRRIERSVRLYGLIEVVVGISGFTLVLLFPLLTQQLAPLFGSISDHPLALNLLRLGLSFCLLMIPSTAMGMTLPLLVRALYSESPQFGSVLGRLYGWNTLGAVCGTILTEALFVKVFGVKGTGLIAATLNIVSASGALFLAARMKQGGTGRRESSGLEPGVSQLSSRTVRILFAGFLSGAVMLALEVVWFRFLLLFFDAVSMAFAAMLAVVLAGIALGGIVASVWCRRKPLAHNHLSSVALLAGITCILTYVAFAYVVGAKVQFISPWIRTLYFSFPLMFAGSLLSGILFTFIGVTVHEEIGGSLEATGLVAMCNTAGAMLGALTAGLVLLPRAGMELGLFILACSYGVIALSTVDSFKGLVTGRSIHKCPHPNPLPEGEGGSGFAALRNANPITDRYTRPGKYLGYGMVGLFLLCIYFFPFGTMEGHILAVGTEYHRGDTGWKPVAIREGLTETCQYWRKSASGTPVCTRLITNSHSMAANCLSGRRYMRLFAYWPLAVHPSPRSALLICYGVGSTAKALTESPVLESIDVVDISSDIVKSSEIVFAGNSDNPLKDPRVKIHIEDGRFFLQVSDRRFDIITAEPPPPLSAGVVNLYSQEYFELIRDRLNQGGIVTYWLPVYQLPWSAIKSIIKTFHRVFPDCSVWTGAGYEWMMVGTRDAKDRVSEEQFERQWRNPAVDRELFYCGLEIPELIGTTFLMDGDDLNDWVAEADLLVDNYPQRIFGKPEDYRKYGLHDLKSVMDTGFARVGFERSKLVQKLWPARLRQETLEYFWVQRLFNEKFCGTGDMPISEEMEQVHGILTKTRLRFPVLLLVGGSAYIDSERILTRKGAGGALSHSNMAFHQGVKAMADREYAQAEQYFATVTETSSNKNIIQYRVYLLCTSGQSEHAKKLVEEHRELFQIKSNAAYLSWLSDTFRFPKSFWK